MSDLSSATGTYYSHVADIAPYLTARGITGRMAQRAMLGYVREPAIGHEGYVGRLSIPYVTAGGVRTIRFRRLDEGDTPKYLSLPGQRPYLYNAGSLLTGGPVACVAEGELDALVLAEVLGLPAVGIPGSTIWQPWWGNCFNGYERVLVFCDGDSPGRDLGKRLATEVPAAVVLHMPDGMDVTDVLLSEGAEGIHRRAGL